MLSTFGFKSKFLFLTKKRIVFQDLLSKVSQKQCLTTIKSDSCSPEIKKSKSKKTLENVEADERTVIVPRQENYAKWYCVFVDLIMHLNRNQPFNRYNSVVTASDMIDQSPVRGCMVIRPWGMGVWDNIRADLDARIRESGAQNAYFPLFIPMSFLSKEAEHVEGFAKECAVVTHHRLCKSDEEGVSGLIPDPAAQLEVCPFAQAPQTN